MEMDLISAEEKFKKGLELSGEYYRKAVRPILKRNFPHLKYSVALIGWGSEVLGYDSSISRDHGWGLRLQLFLHPDHYRRFMKQVDLALRSELPVTFGGISTNFSEPDQYGIAYLETLENGPVRHGIEITTCKKYFTDYLGFEVRKMSEIDWLLVPQNKLLTAIRGAVWFDNDGELTKTRRLLEYFPQQVWFYMLRAQWSRIGGEETYVERCLEGGDKVGANLVLNRLFMDIIRLFFLMERHYAPYIKWLLPEFRKLAPGKRLAKVIQTSMEAKRWSGKLEGLNKCLVTAARRYNALGITPPLKTVIRPYFERPPRVIHAWDFANALDKKITSKALKKIPFYLGSTDQWVDWPWEPANPTFQKALGKVYGKK